MKLEVELNWSMREMTNKEGERDKPIKVQVRRW
jgi:hypothetical protein